MRVIAGKYRGQSLQTREGLDTRPTLDNVKEAMFNIIGFKIYNTTVIDVFSGSGALGIEALSRGAKKVIFNDVDKTAVKYIKSNLTKLKVSEEYEVKNLDYLDFLESINEKIDIVLLDPPYKKYVYLEILSFLEEHNLLNPYALIIFECEKDFKIDIVDGYKVKEYKYGKKKLIKLEKLN